MKLRRTKPPGPPFHDTFLNELAAFCEEGLDQWEMWRLMTEYGPVYITISREPWPGTTDLQYDPLLPDPSRSSR